MTHRWSYEGRLPVIFAAVRSIRTQRVHIAPFLLDTGACTTCLPSFRVKEWDHTEADAIRPFSMPGVGGDCSGLVFPFRFGLLHSRKFTDPPLWEASDCEVVFLNNLDRRFGLIGMDVIRQWRAMTFEPRATGGGVIEIDF